VLKVKTDRKNKKESYIYFQLVQHNTITSNCYIFITKINSLYPSSRCYNFCGQISQMLTVIVALPSTAQIH